VPEVVGKDRFEAERILAKAELNFRVRATRPSNQVNADTVLFQLPRAGEVVKVGQTVAMDISRGVKAGEAAENVVPEDKDNKEATRANGNEPTPTKNDNENRPKKNKNTNKNANDAANVNTDAANVNTNANTNSSAGRANTNRVGVNTNRVGANVNSEITRPRAVGNANANANINSGRPASQNENKRAPTPRPSPTVKNNNP
jgi:beta-lactam-binding protein with PASTA domain